MKVIIDTSMHISNEEMTKFIEYINEQYRLLPWYSKLYWKCYHKIIDIKQYLAR